MMDAELFETEEFMLLENFISDFLKQNKHWLQKNYPLQPHTPCFPYKNRQFISNINLTHLLQQAKEHFIIFIMCL